MKMFHLFLSAHKSLSSIIQKINNVIVYVNDKLFFSNMDKMDGAELNESQPSVASVDGSLYENFSFTVASDKVEINEITYDNGLKVNFKIKDVENLSQDYINTQLDYSYSDDFNDLSGTFDVRINKEEEFDFTGSWQISYYTAYDHPDYGIDYLHQQEKFTLDASGYASNSQVRYPPNPAPRNEWEEAGEINLFYEDGYVVISEEADFKVVVENFDDTVFYSINWDTNFTVNDYYWKIKLEKL